MGCLRQSRTVPGASSLPGQCISLDHLAASVAPAVHGHREAKKGILLMLLGGVQKPVVDGSGGRGQIHVCLLGEPATGKSTLLRWVASFLQRGVYTSGVSSSAPGLTAAVLPDEDSGGRAIRPGALALAADSVCCIDDFEQMDPKDQSAIREVMDQQTITVAKAGIVTKLHANASVLVACTPQGRSFASLPMPLHVASCFDLVHMLKDACGSEGDEGMARRILERTCRQGSSEGSEVSAASLRHYLHLARQVNPVLSSEAQERLTNCYCELRRQARTSTLGAGWANARTLESLARLSEAVARGHLQECISAEHVAEALELARPALESRAGCMRGQPLKRARHSGA